MRPEIPCRPAYGRWLALVILLLVPAGLGARSEEPADPVEALRQTLSVALSRQPPVEGDSPEEAAAKEAAYEKAVALHKKRISECVGCLGTLGDLYRALLLKEWDGHRLLDRTGLEILSKSRTEVAGRFRKEAEALLQGQNALGRLAAARLVGELAEQARMNVFVQQQLAELAPALKQLAEGKDPAAAAAAALALGKVEAPPEVVVPVLRRLLAAQDVAVRRTAARALGEPVRGVVQQMQFVNVPEEAQRKRFDSLAVLVVPAAAAGLGDGDAEVRRLCLDGLREAAQVVADQMRNMFPNGPFAQGNVPEQQLKQIRAQVQKEQQRLQPLLLAFKEQIPALGRALDDADARAAVKAAEVLEALAEVQQRLRPPAANSPPAAPADKADDPLGEALRAAVPLLARHLTAQKEVRLQLACLYVLESLRQDAAAAVPEVVQALKDPNAYVRWGAVRVLGRLAPLEADRAVPCLAPLLKDDNEYVRATTVLVLARYGPKVKAAVPALRDAAKSSDAGLRLLAIKALLAAGLEGAPAVPELGQALAADDVEVRLAAVEALKRLGPLARDAEKPLRRALDDPDDQVRLLAAEALLRLR
jgi:HEAT repeat protein